MGRDTIIELQFGAKDCSAECHHCPHTKSTTASTTEKVISIFPLNQDKEPKKLNEQQQKVFTRIQDLTNRGGENPIDIELFTSLEEDIKPLELEDDSTISSIAVTPGRLNLDAKNITTEELSLISKEIVTKVDNILLNYKKNNKIILQIGEFLDTNIFDKEKGDIDEVRLRYILYSMLFTELQSSKKLTKNDLVITFAINNMQYSEFEDIDMEKFSDKFGYFSHGVLYGLDDEIDFDKSEFGTVLGKGLEPKIVIHRILSRLNKVLFTNLRIMSRRLPPSDERKEVFNYEDLRITLEPSLVHLYHSSHNINEDAFNFTYEEFNTLLDKVKEENLNLKDACFEEVIKKGAILIV